MKRKAMAGFLLLSMLAAGCLPATPARGEAAAQRWAKGIVRTAETVQIFAPVGGQVQDFDWEAGDVLAAGEAAFTLRPRQALAPEDGVIRLVKARVGDQAADIIGRYGALCYIERTDVAWVQATISTAYDAPENRALQLGETLRVYNGKTEKPISTRGTVVSVAGRAYVVEIPAGVFELEDKVRLYRGEGTTYAARDRVGEGKVERISPVAITSAGVVANVLVEDGQKVARGDALFTLDDAGAVHGEPAASQAVSPAQGVVSALFVQPGQQVMKEQLLMTLLPLEKLEFVVDVDEMDIAAVAAGQTMRVKVDALGMDTIAAKVERISPLGITVLDTTKYPVTLSVADVPEGLLPGMHVTAYWE